MPRKLENGKYAFKSGCIGEKGADGKYKLVAVQKKKINKSKKITKEKNDVKKRRSQKKTFRKPTQKGGNNSSLNITVHMLREFYSKNFK